MADLSRQNAANIVNPENGKAGVGSTGLNRETEI